MSSTSTRTAPAVVKSSFWLWIAVGVLLAVIAIVGSFRPVDVSALPETERSFAALVPISAAVGGTIAGLLHVLFAVFLLRGKNWARIVLTVVGALTLIGLAMKMALGDWASGISLVLTVAAIVLMYLPASNAYFRRR